MPKFNENQRRYQKINYETRKKIIDLVLCKNMKVSQAASILKVSHSTARSIVTSYKLKGAIFETKEDKMKRVLLEGLKKKTMVQPIQTSQDPKQGQSWIWIQYFVNNPYGYEENLGNEREAFMMEQ